jgi:hypothetical protein
MKMRSFLLVSLATASAVAQQPVATRTLAKPDAEYAEPFTQITGFRELRDGRIVVSDSRDKTLQAIDFRSGAAAKIGHEGSGPLEWTMPGRILGMPGDTAFVVDALNSRFFVVGPDGRAGSTMSPVGAGGAGRVLSARVTDAMGRFYLEGLPFTFGPNGPVVADSVPLIRSDITGTKQDTLVWLQVARASVSGSSGAGQVSVQFRGAPPFQSGDDWTVFPDGRIAIARVADFHIDMIQPNGRRLSGTPFNYTSVKIGNGEKEEWRNARRNAQTVTMSGNGNVTRSVGTGAAGNAVQDPSEWPPAKSAFGTGSTWPAPNGETWVFHSRRADDLTPVAEVFDTRGQLTGRVVLPPGTHVVGFGARSVYLARVDKDDLQYLQRYAMAWSTFEPRVP